MYTVDELDTVRKLELPEMDPNAPFPRVVADEDETRLSYGLHPGDWDAPEWRRVEITFQGGPQYVYFGGPNDEALGGHPLYGRGLEPYDVFEVLNSSWIRSMECMNSAHPHHDPSRFQRLRHYIFTFHDSTFECIAEGFKVREVPGQRSTV